MNQNIISTFQKLIQVKNKELKELKKNPEHKSLVSPLQFRIRNYVKVVKIIQEYPQEITEGKQLKDQKGIGKGTIDRINEILTTGTLSEIPQETESVDTLAEEKKLLLQITGVGERKSDVLLEKNITLKKLEEELEKLNGKIDNLPEDSILQELTHHQLIGLKYLEDINLRIPRLEIEKLEKKIKKFVSEIDSKLEVIICGSYRRQAPNSGDIDMLILHPDLKTPDDIQNHDVNFLPVLVEKLTAKKLLVAHLTENGLTKYMGLCKLTSRSKARRIDIRFIAYQSKGAAMLYFTGSGTFNEIMRAEALKKKYTINEYGIYHAEVTGSRKKRKVEKGALVPTQTEKDIFDVIGKTYVEPQNRK